MKTDHMIQKNKAINAAKTEAAIACINEMLRNDEEVAVCELTKISGLSRSFFYNNPIVHEELERARELQAGKSFVTKRKAVIDKAMKRKIELLENEIRKKDTVILELQDEVNRLRKAADAKTISIIREL